MERLEEKRVEVLCIMVRVRKTGYDPRQHNSRRTGPNYLNEVWLEDDPILYHKDLMRSEN